MTDGEDDWKPTCRIEVLKHRAIAFAAVRQFFDQLGYVEVETPLLSGDTVVDAYIDPIAAATTPPRFLQTSPEAAMKRLLSAGMNSCYQITKAFRAGETGRLHNPEFTIIEWYGLGTTWEQQIQLTERLVRSVRQALHDSIPTDCFSQPFSRVTYQSAFERIGITGVLDKSAAQLGQLVLDRLPEYSSDNLPDNRDDLLNMLLSDLVEPELGIGTAEFLTSYPLSQAALAEVNHDDPRTACRFELYHEGIELCNGYHELVDPAELRMREQQQNNLRSVTLPGAGRLSAAMKSGLPACAGVALGFDRLMMCLLGAEHIREVIAFPFERA